MEALSGDASLEEVQAYFRNDHFATDACGCEVLGAGPGWSKCAFAIEGRHRNQQGAVMGGAIFTLADFALAVASNYGRNPTVSVSNTMEFLSPAKGQRLIADAKADRNGRSLGFFTVDVTDELGTRVARMTATCYRRA